MNIRRIIALSALLVCLMASGQERLRREDSFLGVHFDFHAGAGDKGIGARTTPGMVQAIIDMVHPDYLQIDCKGHAGYSSYPTEVGNPAPGVVGDPLAVWRKVTADNGVALYLHYSGVWDFRAVELHPEWAVVERDGNPSKTTTSVFGPYVDKLLIPQLKELAGKYGADGVWVDGECWGTAPDYGERAVRMFRELTGAKAPKTPQDPLWFEWIQFHREAFRNYLRHYTAAVGKDYPGFQICSNWAFTHHMSEPVSAAVDFLSGDYSPSNSVNSARIAARYLANQGMPWDLMAWSFGYENNKVLGQKSSVQLMREAAVTLSQGGGFQAYFQQERDGSVNLEKLKPMADAARFARARQKYCHHSVTVPQVVVLLSTYDYQHHPLYGENPWQMFPNYTGRAGGILECLLESQYSVDLAGENTLLPDMSRYPLIVVPECDQLSPLFRDDLLKYAREGGSLLVIGKEMTEFFSEAALTGTKGPEWFSAPFGNGRIGFIPEGISEDYEAGKDQEKIRSKVKALVGGLFPEPVAEVVSSPYVDVSVRELGGKLQIHLVNTSGDHRNSPFTETVEPVRGIKVSVRTGGKPSEIIRQPDGNSLKFKYKDGKVTFRLDSLEIYDIIEISE